MGSSTDRHIEIIRLAAPLHFDAERIRVERILDRSCQDFNFFAHVAETRKHSPIGRVRVDAGRERHVTEQGRLSGQFAQAFFDDHPRILAQTRGTGTGLIVPIGRPQEEQYFLWGARQMRWNCSLSTVMATSSGIGVPSDEFRSDSRLWVYVSTPTVPLHR